MDIYLLYAPIFLGLFHQNQVIGVLSGHGTGQDGFRIRGLYVEPEFRNHGGAHLLMEGMRVESAKQGFTWMWSYPKLSALPVYEKFGFKIHPSSEADSEHVYVLRKTET
ncbi:GNAT family N-acetyltransferase [Bdellovibrio sp. HCB2-146]|uniref:GNAT family N-acetyltransferase n=1 Tax=Bdellovibrio sp. HCB2-146 TaxID=3394362 RepID=UPI0039BD3808